MKRPGESNGDYCVLSKPEDGEVCIKIFDPLPKLPAWRRVNSDEYYPFLAYKNLFGAGINFGLNWTTEEAEALLQNEKSVRRSIEINNRTLQEIAARPEEPKLGELLHSKANVLADALISIAADHDLEVFQVDLQQIKSELEAGQNPTATMRRLLAIVPYAYSVDYKLRDIVFNNSDFMLNSEIEDELCLLEKWLAFFENDQPDDSAEILSKRNLFKGLAGAYLDLKFRLPGELVEIRKRLAANNGNAVRNDIDAQLEGQKAKIENLIARLSSNFNTGLPDQSNVASWVLLYGQMKHRQQELMACL